MNQCWKWIEKIIYSVLAGAFRLFSKELTDEKFAAFMQFVKFGIVGLSNTLISYVIYVGFLLLFQKLGILGRADYLVAQLVGFVLSVLWSFYWNNKMVFTKEDGQKRVWWKALLKTYVSYSFTGVFLNSILIVIWVQILGVSEFVAPILNLLISVPLNFIMNKFWAFK